MRNNQYYSITVNPSSNRLLFTINISLTGNNWQFFKVDFVASTRSDIQLGIYKASSLLFYSAISNNNSSQQFQINLKKSISNAVVVTFVSGFQVSNNLNNLPLTLSITNSQSSGNSLSVLVNTNFAKNIDISYIVYDSSSLQRSYLVSQGSIQLGLTSINNTKFFAGTTNLFGFNGFTSSSNNYFDYSSRLNSFLSANVSTKTLNKVTVSYIIIETLPSQYCSNCTSGGIYQQGYCVMMCDASSIIATTNGAQSCIICDIQKFMVKTQDNSSCICAIQYYQPIGSAGCVACNPSCVTCNGPNPNNCTSCDNVPAFGTNRILVNGACNCIDKYYSTVQQGYSCIPCHYSCLTCSGKGSNNCLSCSINVGRNLNGNICSCRSGYNDNGQSQSCICENPLPDGSCSVPLSCQLNQIILNNTCQCANGFFNISGQCNQCQLNQYFNQGVCISCTNGQVSTNKTQCNCNNGFYKIGGICQQCKSNQIYSNSSQICTCSSGFYSVNGVCQSPPTNQIYNGSSFVCNTGFFNISGNCATCSGNQVYNSTSQTCGCTNGLILIDGRCQSQTVTPPIPPVNNQTNTTCSQNMTFNGRNCVCLNGFYNISGVCTPCPQNSFFNGQNCVCNQGFFNISGNCTNNPTCSGANQYFNGVTCLCYPGYSNNSGNCTYGCGQNQVLTPNGCQCSSGYYNISGNCSTCPQSSYFNGLSCICNNGLYMINGVCRNCGANESYNGSTCICSQNTYNISGSCQSCPSNSRFNGSVCQCNTGFTMNQNRCVQVTTPSTPSTPNNTSNQSSQCGFGNWNGFQCVCNQGYYLIQGKCNICPSGAYFNGQTCICQGGAAYINGACTSCPNYSYFNGITCICYGGLIYSNNVCISCPQGSYNTGTTCQCISGIYSSQTNTCIVCYSPAIFNGNSCACPQGQYLQQNSCLRCSNGCSVCSSANLCTSCNNGFTLNNGACNSNISPTNPTTPGGNRITLTNQGFSLYPGYIVASININPFPAALQANNCMYCGNVLRTSIVSGVNPQILTGYAAPSTLHILFGFGNSQPRPFVANININPQYSSFFPGMNISATLTLNVTQNVINGRQS